ncbi:MAG: 50S ribosomal protein L23 [Endomicrobium sp.]|jgi:large subunit ribosomal protein L23|nr:50S ribosomal protein L23 [Endomicrobium sp.]
MNLFNILKKPIITSKTAKLKYKNNEYVFMVDKYANKFQIKHAVESLFKVKVVNVNTANFIGKQKRIGKNVGYKNDWKKAIIKLSNGQEIHVINKLK